MLSETDAIPDKSDAVSVTVPAVAANVLVIEVLPEAKNITTESAPLRLDVEKVKLKPLAFVTDVGIVPV